MQRVGAFKPAWAIAAWQCAFDLASYADTLARIDDLLRRPLKKYD